MKKILSTCLALSIMTVVSLAQGLVSFNNSSGAGSKISTNSAVGGGTVALYTASVGSYYYALFSAATNTTTVNGGSSSVIPTGSGVGSYVFSDANWTFQGMATNSATAGRVSGPGSMVLSGVVGGTSANFIVLGWSSNLGTTVSALQASLAALGGVSGTAYLGQSGIGLSIVTGDGNTALTPTILASSGAVTGFTLGVVMEKTKKKGVMYAYPRKKGT